MFFFVIDISPLLDMFFDMEPYHLPYYQFYHDEAMGQNPGNLLFTPKIAGISWDN